MSSEGNSEGSPVTYSVWRDCQGGKASEIHRVFAAQPPPPLRVNPALLPHCRSPKIYRSIPRQSTPSGCRAGHRCVVGRATIIARSATRNPFQATASPHRPGPICPSIDNPWNTSRVPLPERFPTPLRRPVGRSSTTAGRRRRFPAFRAQPATNAARPGRPDRASG